MVEVEDLRNRNPRAWTLLLTQEFEADDIIVAAVGEEPLEANGNTARFLLSLSGHPEPLGLIGKHTNAIEALFYEVFAPQFPHFTPKCYFSHIGLEDGWLALVDVPNDHPPETWAASDIEILIGSLASLHAANQGQRDVLEQYGFPTLLEEPETGSAPFADEDAEGRPAEQPLTQMERIERWLQEQRRYLTEHAIRTAGPLTPSLAEASKGLETLKRLNGWPGIIDDRHLTALADLMDDPLPVLFPLRQLPYTLLHTDPAPERWRLTLFDDHYLLDWHKSAIGPGVYDLVSFIDHFELLLDERFIGQNRRLRMTEETMVDSYILAMRGEMGTQFDARATRLAIPAARCLLVLTHWLPRLAQWLRELPFDQEAWQTMGKLSDDELINTGLSQLVGLRASLATVFERFLRAYRSL